MTNDTTHDKELTIIIAGSTASGKTGTAVALAKMLSDKGAVVKIEDYDGPYACELAMEDGRFDVIAPRLNVVISTIPTSQPNTTYPVAAHRNIK